MQIFEVIGFVIVFAVIMLCAACSFGRAPVSGRVPRMTRSRPSDKTVDGYGGIRGWDSSYSPGVRDAAGPFPVGGKTEREKTETYKAYSDDDDE
ncbi:MAG: hypothetical protein ACFFF4_05835 [Candidatus Thorarchaeota archaeon]